MRGRASTVAARNGFRLVGSLLLSSRPRRGRLAATVYSVFLEFNELAVIKGPGTKVAYSVRSQADRPRWLRLIAVRCIASARSLPTVDPPAVPLATPRGRYRRAASLQLRRKVPSPVYSTGGPAAKGNGKERGLPGCDFPSQRLLDDVVTGSVAPTTRCNAVGDGASRRTTSADHRSGRWRRRSVLVSGDRTDESDHRVAGLAGDRRGSVEETRSRGHSVARSRWGSSGRKEPRSRRSWGDRPVRGGPITEAIDYTCLFMWRAR